MFRWFTKIFTSNPHWQYAGGADKTLLVLLIILRPLLWTGGHALIFGVRGFDRWVSRKSGKDVDSSAAEE